MLRKILYLIVGIIVLGVLYYLSGYGYIQVDSTSQINMLTLNSGASENNKEIENYTGQKVLVRRDNYQLFATNDEGGFFALIESPRFFQTVVVGEEIKPESQRQFKFTDPLPCVYQFGAEVFSSPCGSSMKDMVRHVPGTRTTPPYTTPANVTSSGFIEGFFSDNNKDYLMVKEPTGHTLYVYDDGFVLDKVLTDLDANTFYSLSSKETPLVISSSESSNYFVLELGLSLRKGELKTDHEDTPLKLVVNAGGVNVLFYSDSSYQGTDFISAEGVEYKSKDIEVQNEKKDYIVVGGDKTENTLEANDIQSIIPCGDNYICIKKTTSISIYDIVGKSIVSDIYGATDLAYHDNTLIISFGRVIVVYDISKKTGGMIYRYPDNFEACGIADLHKQLYVCVENESGKKSVLHVQPDESTVYYIDKKIAELEAHSIIGSISAYNETIYVAPRLDEPSYNQETGEFGYDPEYLQDVNTFIQELIQAAKIPDNGYRVFNPLSQ